MADRAYGGPADRVKSDAPHEAAFARPGSDAVAAEEATTARVWDIVLIVAVVLLAGFMLVRPFLLPSPKGDHYLYLAESLVHGKVSVNTIPDVYADIVHWGSDKYLPFGPFPSALLIPFLPFFWLTGTRDLVWVGDLLTLANIFLMWRVLRQIGVEGERRKWALLLFFGGTIYYGVAVVDNSWYFAHVVVTTLLLLAVWEALGRRRWWLVGLYLGLAGLTRFTAVFALPFFLWLIWKRRQTDPAGPGVETTERVSRRDRLSGYLALFVGLAGPLLLQLAYNYARFGSVTQSGYGLATLLYKPLLDARSQGLFSLVHVPKNLVMMLFQGPIAYPSENAAVLQFPYFQPSKWGMGLLFTTPAFVYLFRAKLRDRFVQACLLATVCIMVPLITYYGVGWIQFGYRYGLDFIPFLFLITVLALPRPLTGTARVLILASAAINVWGAIFLSFWV